MKQSEFLIELFMDIDLGRVQPLTSVKNIEAVLTEFVHEYEDYENMLEDLQEWGYVRLV